MNKAAARIAFEEYMAVVDSKNAEIAALKIDLELEEKRRQDQNKKWGAEIAALKAERFTAERYSKEHYEKRKIAEADVTALKDTLHAEQSKRVNEYARAALLIEWIKDPERKPAIHAFTEGPERQVAYAVERELEALKSKLAEAEKALRRIQSLAGHPDPLTACRNTIKAASSALASLRPTPSDGQEKKA